MDNPFRYGLLVDEPFFTDRKEELQYIVQFLQSENQLVLISPRRYGKSSLVRKAVLQTGRPCVYLNLQQVTSVEDFSSMIVKEVYRLYPIEKVKHLLSSFRIVPTLSTSPSGDSLEISFNPKILNTTTLLEDALGLLQKVTSPEARLVVVLDEFPELLEIEKRVDKRLRAIMQGQIGLNYIFLGSQESMMEDIFEKVKSPFYHFGMVMHLGKIPYDDFHTFVASRMKSVVGDNYNKIADGILKFTGCHPYYTQQLAARCWESSVLHQNTDADSIVEESIELLVHAHDLDFERLWLTMTKVSRKILQLLSVGDTPYQERSLPTSTSYSALKKLMKEGIVIRSDKYEIEDPFFKKWIEMQLN